VVICLERGADLHMALWMPLPLTVSCFSKIQIGFSFLVPAHPGSPGQRAVKRVCVCVYAHDLDQSPKQSVYLSLRTKSKLQSETRNLCLRLKFKTLVSAKDKVTHCVGQTSGGNRTLRTRDRLALRHFGTVQVGLKCLDISPQVSKCPKDTSDLSTELSSPTFRTVSP